MITLGIRSTVKKFLYTPFGFRLRGYLLDLKGFVGKLWAGFLVKLESFLGYPMEKKKFFKATGYELNLDDPVSFNQKIVWNKLYDHSPLRTLVADKYRVREYLASALGSDEAGKIGIPILHVSDDPGTIPFDQLPEEYIIKFNHESGSNLIIKDGPQANRKIIQLQCKKRMARDYGLRKREWAYVHIERKLIIEPLLRDAHGRLPDDYKFHMIHGKCAFIQVDQERFTFHSRTLYDQEWNLLPVSYQYRQGEPVKKPVKLDYMLNLAHRLSQPFDYIRVDLYEIDGKVYFGELTNYPESGDGKFDPVSFDFELGKKWNDYE